MLEMATPSAIRLPWIVRLSTSRPKRSVPNGWASEGRWSASITFISVGSYGATTPANAASSTMATMIPAPKSTRALRSAGRTAHSAMADARIDVGVQQVDDEVRHHEECADEQD